MKKVLFIIMALLTFVSVSHAEIILGKQVSPLFTESPVFFKATIVDVWMNLSATPGERVRCDLRMIDPNNVDTRIERWRRLRNNTGNIIYENRTTVVFNQEGTHELYVVCTGNQGFTETSESIFIQVIASNYAYWMGLMIISSVLGVIFIANSFPKYWILGPIFGLISLGFGAMITPVPGNPEVILTLLQYVNFIVVASAVIPLFENIKDSNT